MIWKKIIEPNQNGFIEFNRNRLTQLSSKIDIFSFTCPVLYYNMLVRYDKIIIKLLNEKKNDCL